MIQAPVTARFASSTPSSPESWRRLDRREKPRSGELVRSQIVGVKPAYVWDVSQTDGELIPEPPRAMLLKGQTPDGLWDGLTAQVDTVGYALHDVSSASGIRGANGMTNFANKTIQVRADMDQAARVKTLAHELAHVLLHEPDNDGRSLHRGIGEVEA